MKSNDDWTKLDNATIIMQDAPVLDIDKTDIAGNLLPGATLTIRDAGGEVIDTWVTDYKTHSVPISDEFIKLSDGNKEYIYTLTEDAAPAGFEIAESVQFKVQQADENVCLFVRENADAEWVRADKRLIQMIDEATPREDTPTPTYIFAFVRSFLRGNTKNQKMIIIWLVCRILQLKSFMADMP